MTTNPSKSSRILELDALRGIAASSVMLFHYTSHFNIRFGHDSAMPLRFDYGAYGVSLFFIISGFVIFMTLDRRPSVKDFALGRFFRLFPAYWAAVLLAYLVALALPDVLFSGSDLLWNLTMVQGLFDKPYIDGVYWTLQVELIFYAAMAVLLRAGLLSPGRSTTIACAWILVSLAWFAVMQMALAGPGEWVDYQWLRRHPRCKLLTALLLAQYIHLFALGLGLYDLVRGGRLRTGHLILVGLAAVHDLVWAHPTALLIDGVCLLLVCLAVLLRLRLFRLAPLAFLGTISYSLYLIHENLGYAILLWGYDVGIPPILGVAIALGVALGVASLLYRFVEQPFQELSRGWRRKPSPAATGVPGPATVLPEAHG
jgi:peptidoglycan/LPS O-acetylase OafA/YrhL